MDILSIFSNPALLNFSADMVANSGISDSVILWLASPAAIVSVALPAIVALSMLPFWAKHVNLAKIAGFIVLTWLSYLTCYWTMTPKMAGLHIIPFVGVAILIAVNYQKMKINLAEAFSYTFFSMLIVDYMESVRSYAVMKSYGATSVVEGIGGAGLHDNLLNVPIVVVVAVWLMQIKINNKNKLATSTVLSDKEANFINQNRTLL